MPRELAFRRILPDEFSATGQMTRAAYVAAGVIDNEHEYGDQLEDIAGHLADGKTEVFVATVGAKVVGTITYCPYGSDLTIVCEPGDYEFRMLAVDPEFGNRGIARGLIDYCDEFAATQGLTTSVACAAAHNTIAIAMYQRLGFAAVPERDWSYSDSVRLLTYVRPIGRRDG